MELLEENYKIIKRVFLFLIVSYSVILFFSFSKIVDDLLPGTLNSLTSGQTIAIQLITILSLVSVQLIIVALFYLTLRMIFSKMYNSSKEKVFRSIFFINASLKFLCLVGFSLFNLATGIIHNKTIFVLIIFVLSLLFNYFLLEVNISKGQRIKNIIFSSLLSLLILI